MLRVGLLTKREKNCLKYRWEFLRRNVQYMDDYIFIVRKLRIVDLIKNSHPESQKDKALKILSKWGLLNPIPPSMSFEELIESDRKTKTLYIDALLVEANAIDCFDNPDLLNDRDVFTNGRFLEIRVNMSLAKQKICDEFSLMVDRWQKRLKEIEKTFPKQKVTPRVLPRQFKHYLNVYDQYVEGVGLDDLAKKFYKHYISSHGMHYARRRAKRDLENSIELIEGGFKQIA